MPVSPLYPPATACQHHRRRRPFRRAHRRSRHRQLCRRPGRLCREIAKFINDLFRALPSVMDPEHWLNGVRYLILYMTYVQAPTLHNLYHSVHCGIFVVIFIVLCTRAIEDLYLNYVCYTILLFCTTFSTVALPGQTEHTIFILVRRVVT